MGGSQSQNGANKLRRGREREKRFPLLPSSIFLFFLPFKHLLFFSCLFGKEMTPTQASYLQVACLEENSCERQESKFNERL